MNFDRIAPFYELVEVLFAGGMLQKCRTEFLDDLEPPRNVLILGEGNGRFLNELLLRFPDSRVTCVDGSSEMIRLAAERLRKNGLGGCSVKFIHQDIAKWEPAERGFDLLVVHFFLDCFERAEIRSIVEKLKIAAKSNAILLLSDFQEPAGFLRGKLSRVLLSCLYRFFGFTAGVRTRRIISPDEILVENGFNEVDRRLSVFNLLTARKWKQGQPEGEIYRKDVFRGSPDCGASS
ncbi:class I SAM-dependent methyltransferase [Luteolibacter sp. AS25]|uniref:class I SAM-dependent methyltransferase n=1 Tax=Luteolibacter sp. AS25 TaxID=3135776 RepID=UPI00398AB03A